MISALFTLCVIAFFAFLLLCIIFLLALLSLDLRALLREAQGWRVAAQKRETESARPPMQVIK